MTAVRFTVPGKVQPWQRAGRSPNGMTFTKRETRNYEAFVKLSALQAMAGRPLLDGALRLEIDCVFPIPSSWPKRKQADAAAGKILPTIRRDWDNLGKGISDALNGIAYADDGQVCEALVRKLYGDAPRAVVSISRIGEAA